MPTPAPEARSPSLCPPLLMPCEGSRLGHGFSAPSDPVGSLMSLLLEQEPELGPGAEPCLSAPRCCQASQGQLDVGPGALLWGAEALPFGVRLRGGLHVSPGCRDKGGEADEGRGRLGPTFRARLREETAPQLEEPQSGRGDRFCPGSPSLRRGVPRPCSGAQLRRRQGPHTYHKDI